MEFVQAKKSHVHGRKSVGLALLGNALVTIFKLAGFLISGSSALFSEAVHSLADTMNQSLLMIGIKRSAKEADQEFSYGYGHERFLWALISACGIFFLGAGVTVNHGIEALNSKEIVILHPVLFLILFVSFVIEAFTFYAAYKELRSSDKTSGIKDLLINGDPTTIAVIYEDGVALLGVLTAFASILLSLVTKNYYWDGIGSIIIGLMLAVVAILLIDKNRSYLIKKSVPEEIQERVIELLHSDPAIEKVLDFKSSILDIGRYHIKCEVEFNGPALLAELVKKTTLKEEYDAINGDYEEFKKFFVNYIDRIPRVIGQRIDKIENKIKNEIPEIVHIDIEIN